MGNWLWRYRTLILNSLSVKLNYHYSVIHISLSFPCSPGWIWIATNSCDFLAVTNSAYCIFLSKVLKTVLKWNWMWWSAKVIMLVSRKFCRKSRKTAPPYRVILHNDNYNKREYVVQVLMKVIPGMTLDNAVNIMQEAHYNGLSVVIICAQADAEDHCMQLRGNGLLSSIEPASGGGCWRLPFGSVPLASEMYIKFGKGPPYLCRSCSSCDQFETRWWY